MRILPCSSGLSSAPLLPAPKVVPIGPGPIREILSCFGIELTLQKFFARIVELSPAPELIIASCQPAVSQDIRIAVTAFELVIENLESTAGEPINWQRPISLSPGGVGFEHLDVMGNDLLGGLGTRKAIPILIEHRVNAL